MATTFQHRLILVVPVAKVATVVAWIQANIDPNAVSANLGPALNPSGLSTDPVTHNWCSWAVVDGDCRQILVKLCQLAGVTPPTLPQWQGWTRPQKIAWLQSVQATLLSGYGVWVALSLNDGIWDDPAAALATMGLKVQATPAV